MTVLYFIVWAVIGIPVAALTVGLFRAKHHRRNNDTMMWHG
jgi:hypothetical protein